MTDENKNEELKPDFMPTVVVGNYALFTARNAFGEIVDKYILINPDGDKIVLETHIIAELAGELKRKRMQGYLENIPARDVLDVSLVKTTTTVNL